MFQTEHLREDHGRAELSLSNYPPAIYSSGSYQAKKGAGVPILVIVEQFEQRRSAQGRIVVAVVVSNYLRLHEILPAD